MSHIYMFKVKDIVENLTTYFSNKKNQLP